MSIFVSSHEFVNRALAHHLSLGSARDATHPTSARNLHENPQILNGLGKRAANARTILGAWGKSSPFGFRARDCHDGYSTMAGGSNRCLFNPP
jgi:hypothetical protein